MLYYFDQYKLDFLSEMEENIFGFVAAVSINWSITY